jgi:hypothetical protein
MTITELRAARKGIAIQVERLNRLIAKDGEQSREANRLMYKSRRELAEMRAIIGRIGAETARQARLERGLRGE